MLPSISCLGQEVGVAKQEEAAEEAKPGQGDRRGEFVSGWRFVDQRIKELASFLLARECLFLPVAPYTALLWLLVHPSNPPPSTWLEVACHLNPTPRLAGLCSKVP